MDLGLQGDGLRAITATVGYDTKLLKLFQTFYYTRAVTLIPSLQQFAERKRKEAGTLRGSQWSPSIFIGNREKGLYGGTSFFFDFENNRFKQCSPLVSLAFHTRLRGRLLRGRRPILHLQRRRPPRKPLRFQLPPQRHRHLRHGADRSGLKIKSPPKLITLLV